MATVKWIPPLPPGVEARWDPNQRAYFYIDHNTKLTSWQDPRPDYYAKQPKDHPPPNPKLGQNKDPVFGFRNSGNVPNKDDGITPDLVKLSVLKDNFPDVSEEVLRIVLKTKKNNVAEARNQLIKSGHKCKIDVDHSSAGQLQIDTIVKKLQKIYPLARYDIIRDIVAGCGNNESAARTQLESMGYKPVADATTSLTTTTTRPKSSSTRSRSPSPSPKPQKISDAEITRITTRMKGEFHDLGEDFIKMALESVNYEEDKFRRMVEHYRETQKQTKDKADANKKAEDDISFKPSGSLVPEAFVGGSEAVVFEHSIDEDPSGSSTPVPFVQKTDSPKKTTKTVTKKQKETNKETKTTTSTALTPHSKQKTSKETIEQHAARLRAQKSQQARTKQVTHTKSTHVVHTQPKSLLAKGPDPTMRKGPDKDLLLTDYAVACGPNLEYHQGPDSSRVRGSQGACGPDPSLPCGAQSRRTQLQTPNPVAVNAI